MWLLDPYDYVIGTLQASYIVSVLNSGSQVSIVSTTNSQYTTNVPGLNQTNPGTGAIWINADIIAAQQNGGGYPGINFVTDGTAPIYLGANINVRGTVQFSGPVVLSHAGNLSIIAQNPIIFNSTIDADPNAGNPGLVLTGSSVILGGCVSCTPGKAQLSSLSISAPNGITLYGGLKTSGTALTGTTASIMLSGPVSLMKSVTLDSSNADLVILDAVTTSTTPGQFGSPESTTNLIINAGIGYSQGGRVYFGSTVNLTGSLTLNNAGMTYLAGNVTTTAAQTYNGSVQVLGGNVQLQTTNGNVIITGALQGGALANSSIYLYQNGYYSIDGGEC
jgi:hypothetical protein